MAFLLPRANPFLFYSYNVVSNLILKFRLIVEHSKTEVFYFTRLQSSFNPPLLNLSYILKIPKDI